MAQLNTLLDRIHDEIPSVPEALALRALSDSVKEFCVRTHIWQAELPRISLRPGTATYSLYPDTGQQIAALKDVRLDGRKINPVATERVRVRAQSPRASTPMAYIQVSPDAIELTAAPVDADRLTVVAALTLALGEVTADVPDALIDEYGEALAAGAKMRLVRQASQPWTAPDAVMNYAGPYYTAIATAKSRAMSALGEANMQIEMRSWA